MIEWVANEQKWVHDATKGMYTWSREILWAKPDQMQIMPRILWKGLLQQFKGRVDSDTSA